MKSTVFGILFLLFTSLTVKSKAQAPEIEQLLLNVEKLAQFKQMLADLKHGYEIVSQGYGTIKNISEGNFNLHQLFLDGLLQVSPAVRNYKKIAEIISKQLQLINEYKNAYRQFREVNLFAAGEMDYIGQVYKNLMDESVKNLETLVTIITDGVLRMSDDERLSAIDALHEDMQDKLDFLRHFNSKTKILLLQRLKEQNNINTTKKLYGLH